MQLDTALPVHPATGLTAIGFWRDGRPIWPVLGASDDHQDDDSSEGDSAVEDDDDAAASDDDHQDDGAAQLGDAGKRALDAMKAKWRTERDRARQLAAELAATKKPADYQPDLDAIRAEAAQEATAKANARVLRSEIKAAATGKLANPALALRLLDLDQFDVDADGNVDADEISDAIAALLEENPGLGVTQGDTKRFKGSADGGKRGQAGKPQLTEADVKKLAAAGKHAEIEAARLDGRLNELLGIT